jgi:molybdate transport system substrate-binding protein
VRNILVVVLCLFAPAGCQRAATDSASAVTASVAASLQQPMTVLQSVYERSHPGHSIIINFGSSGALARQIQEGAPVDVFFSAAAEPMDELGRNQLIVAETRRDLLRNHLVLIAPNDRAAPQSFAGLADGAVRTIALGEPRSVPAGVYGKQTLEALRLWERVEPKLVLAKDARQVLNYVETGNADAGLVYGTDAKGSPRVRIVAKAPEKSHQPIVYPVAVLKESRNQPAARAFVQFLGSPEAAAVFRGHGFEVVGP